MVGQVTLIRTLQVMGGFGEPTGAHWIDMPVVPGATPVTTNVGLTWLFIFCGLTVAMAGLGLLETIALLGTGLGMV